MQKQQQKILQKQLTQKVLKKIRKLQEKDGNIAGDARRSIENSTGKSVITRKNAIEFDRLIEDVINSKTIEDKNEHKNKE